GLLGLVRDPTAVHAALRSIAPCATTVVCSDAVTALASVHGLVGGGVVAAGTGVIGFGGDFRGIWRRVDGWGHVLGDEGGGAWIGTQGLRAALRAHDGRRAGSEALRALAEKQF